MSQVGHGDTQAAGGRVCVGRCVCKVSVVCVHWHGVCAPMCWGAGRQRPRKGRVAILPSDCDSGGLGEGHGCVSPRVLWAAPGVTDAKYFSSPLGPPLCLPPGSALLAGSSLGWEPRWLRNQSKWFRKEGGNNQGLARCGAHTQPCLLVARWPWMVAPVPRYR